MKYRDRKIDMVTIMFGVMALFLMIMLSVPVSAANFDNVKSFDKDVGNYGKVTIKDWFGLLKLAELELKENTDICLIECSAEKEIILHQKGSLIDEIKFETINYDGTRTQEPIEEYTFYIKKNNKWIKYNLGDEVNPGTYQIRLEGKKSMFKSVDWIITSQGKEIREWAIWDTNAPVAYFSLDETSGKNISNKINATFNGSLSTEFEDVNWIPGKIGNGLLFNESGSHTNFTNITSWGIHETNQTSISFWINFTAHTISNTGVFSIGGQGIELRNVADQFSFGWADLGIQSISTANNIIVPNRWYHIVITQNSSWINETNSRLYINGTLQDWGGNVNEFFWDLTKNDGKFSLGFNYFNNIPINGSIDEFGVWNSTLSQAEVNELYNAGAGLGWGETQSLLITLDSPATGINVTGTQNFTGFFNTTEGHTLVNTTLNVWYSNSTLFSTTTESINGTNNQTTIQVDNINTPKDNYLWNYKACSENSTGFLCRSASSNRTFQTPSFIFGQCNSTNTIAYVNFTFEDESDQSVIFNGTIPSSTFVWWFEEVNNNETFIFSNSVGNQSYAFCFSPGVVNISVDYRIQYEDQEGDYQQRILKPQVTTFSNRTTNITLPLLATVDGQFVTFQVVNLAEQVISGVNVNVSRDISGVDTLIATGTTNDAGSITFFLDPDIEHRLGFSATGYDDLITTLFPTQTSYTITLGTGTIVIQEFDTTKGISYTINPINSTLFNNTAYDFDFILTSSFWEVSDFGFNLVNATGTLAEVSVSANGGTATTNFDVGNNTQIIMNYFWVIDGNYTNASISWYVLSSAGTDWSIKTFFDDFNIYLTSGIFGLDEFGRAIIVFLIIFIFVGVMSFKFGITSPVGITSVIFGLVAFFDIGMGIVPNPVNAIPNFATIFVAIVLTGVLFKEVFR